eukprot:CAMPEP_0118677412 /NCGR_PEP_ID=MMETSP0800-20121206/2614_1 /TAXON_ID=210618 ORGANISM="Striatella unipunctata, Strain CCMP2910" /NCGR_SAMPLE_ID=MMETSP0800 /ASSEMBLY_ACC=CAM_ASM_000638 /LENGTH=367 /DNA_ID=CAMNT_0006573085 /DNA_START=54 /DNA_END=1157 /DNA_ORIENTATION=-
MKVKHGLNSHQGFSYEMLSPAWCEDYFSSDTANVPTKSHVAFSAASRGQLDILITREAQCHGNIVTFRNPKLFKAGKLSTDKDHQHDVIVACTGFEMNFNWISTSDPTNISLNTNPRAWFKHCFPPGPLGEHLAFVGFARPHQGGIPQCSEMVSRYIAQLQLGNLKLPSNFAELAKMEGAAESACYHLAANNRLVVDYLAYMTSVAKLIGCTPKVPLSPIDMIKFWTFPMWPCFFRTQGVGANQAAASAVLDKFGPWDSLAPMPLLAIQMGFSFSMPFVNFFSFCINKMTSPQQSRQSASSRSLPFFYRWRLSMLHFLYQNSLSLDDFKVVPVQWMAATIVIGYKVTESLKSATSSFLTPLFKIGFP